MGTHFKCLVEFNNNRYRICFNNNLNGITFNSVYEELRKIIVESFVSHKTHYFQIFDKDFNEYVIITNGQQIIDNLSRIRVLPKHDIIDNNRDEDITHSAINSSNNSKISRTNKFQEQSMPLNISNTHLKSHSINTDLMFTKNYHNIERDLAFAQIVHQFYQEFLQNGFNDDIVWEKVSKEMFNKGFKKLKDFKECKHLFNSIMCCYVRILESPKSLIYAKMRHFLPLVRKLNSIDLKPFMNPITYEKVVQLKVEKFGKKYKPQNKQINQKLLNVVNSQQNNNIERNESIDLCNTSIEYEKIEENSNQSEDVVMKTDKIDRKQKVVTKVNKSDHNFISNVINEENSESCLQSSESKFVLRKEDSTLIDIIYNNCYQFNNVKPHNFWLIVSKGMWNKNIDINGMECRNRFTDLLELYFRVLKSESTTQTAIKEFNLFSKFNSMFISYPSLYFLFNSYVPENTPKTDINSLQVVNDGQNFADNNYELFATIQLNHKQIIDKVLTASHVDQQIDILRNELLLNTSDYEKRNEIINLFENILSENGFYCELQAFGSTANKLGFRDSDIDLFIKLKERDNIQNKLKFEDTAYYLQRIHYTLSLNLQFFIREELAKPSMRCPVLKVDFKCLEETLQNNGITCDLNLSNPLGPQNTKLIELFCQIEPRFQSLATILRYWAKINGLIGTNQLSSYAFTQLVIFFCQNTSPPLLPTVDHLRQLTKKSLVIQGWNCSFCDDIHLIEKSYNNQSVIDLSLNFFKFYSNFDFKTQVVRPKTGSSVDKSLYSKQRNENLVPEIGIDLKITPICCIEDPFDLNHNLTERLLESVFDKFIELIKQIAINFSSSFDNKVFLMKLFTDFVPKNA